MSADPQYDWYLSGPISSYGKLEENLIVFQKAAKELRDKGWSVFSPPEGEEEGKRWKDYMRRDIAFLTQCRGLALLPFWERSKGAVLEEQIAGRIGMWIRTYAEIGRKDGAPIQERDVVLTQLDSSSLVIGNEKAAKPKKTVLSEAESLVTRDRGNHYGPPEQDFTRTADMVTGLFRSKLKEGEVFTSTDIARFAICLKLSRSMWMKKRDNWVDMAGYAACGHRCDEGEW